MYFDLVWRKVLGTLHDLPNSAQDLSPLVRSRRQDFAALVPDAAGAFLRVDDLLKYQPNGCFGARPNISWEDGALGDVFEETRFASVPLSHDDNLRQLEQKPSPRIDLLVSVVERSKRIAEYSGEYTTLCIVRSVRILLCHIDTLQPQMARNASKLDWVGDMRCSELVSAGTPIASLSQLPDSVF